MGSPEDEVGRWPGEGPQHGVTLSKGYWLADAPCTQSEWAILMRTEPSHFNGPNLPVENVSWDDCQAFCQRLRKAFPGLTARLPSEAEWEYAYRATSTSAFNDGSPCTQPGGMDPALAKLGWFNKNSKARTHDVRGLIPNQWGLYDMQGNVWEWCEDWFGDYVAHEQVDPTGAELGDGRVCRGGSWADPANECRASFRFRWRRVGRYNDLGFRIAAVQ